jgi:hypothetical protein
MTAGSRWRVILLATAFIAACSGIPISSIPRLIKLQGQLLDANPGEFMFAVQLDARMAPPSGAVPRIELAIRPAQPGAFEVVDEKIPMRLTVAPGATLGLEAPEAGRTWLIYSLPPESQATLTRIQATFKRLQTERDKNKGGSVTIGIAQDGLAARDPKFNDTRWESWLQMSRQDGFFKIWSGTVGDLLKAAEG